MLLWPESAKTHGKQKKKFHPMSPVQLLRPFLWVDVFSVFSRFLPPCQSNRVSCSTCWFFFMSGRNFHPDKHPLAKLSPLHVSIDAFIELLIFGYWAIRERKTSLQPTSSGFRHSTVLMFFWYADVLVPHLQRFDSWSLNLQYLYIYNINLLFFVRNLNVWATFCCTKT